MALTEEGPAPYAPCPAVEKFLDHYRDKGFQFPITTKTLVRIGVEESLSRRTLATLKQLDLLQEDGDQTETLQQIRTASTDELEGVLADWVRNAYKPILQYVEPTDSVQRITDQFRHYEPAGMRNRMVTLFLGLCARAGIIPAVPVIPRGSGAAKGATPSKPAGVTKATKSTGSTRGRGKEELAIERARARYAELLIAKAEKEDAPSAELLNRIEQVLGLGGETS